MSSGKKIVWRETALRRHPRSLETLMVHLYLCLPDQCGQKIHKSKKDRRFPFVQFYTVYLLYSYVYSVRTGQAVTHCTHLRFLSRLFHERYEDSSIGDKAQPATVLMLTLVAMSIFEPRYIDASTIAAIDLWRATRKTTRCHYVTRKTYPGAHRPWDLIFSILDILWY